MKKNIIVRLASILLLMLLMAHPVGALDFGKNKVRTRNLQWRILETEHFEIHYYPEEETVAREACDHAEAAYRRVSRFLRYKPQDKTPLFIYRNQIDFQQTTILPSPIGGGTGGFTEAYKNRIALPVTASPKNYREVIFHEFTHAVQNNILFGEGIRSFRIYKGYLIPLWIIEGLAEYAAEDWDHKADMIMRDAVVHDRLIPLTLLDGFSHLEDVFLAYKESQLALQYIAGRFGEAKLAAVFNKFKNQFSASQILRDALGLGLKEFNQDFFYWVRRKYWAQTLGKHSPADLGKPLYPDQPGRLAYTSCPVWSPDGKYLAYVSNRDQIPRVYLKPRNSGSGYPVTSRRFEAFSTSGRPLSWSPDGKQLAFAAREEGRQRLYFLNINTRELRRMELALDDFYSPAWSPDGRSLALIGSKNGITDIYRWYAAEPRLEILTSDRWADDTPCWSRDGRTLFYATERNGYWQLARIHPEVKKNEPVLLTSDSFQHEAPAVSADGKTLFYSCDQNGIYNLFRLTLEPRQIFKLTDVSSGIFLPAPSPDGKRMAFSTYENGSWEIFIMPYDPARVFPEAAANTENSAYPAMVASSPDEAEEETGEIDADEPEDLTPTAQAWEFPDPDGNSIPSQAAAISSRPYSFRFSPDLLFLLAGYDSSQGLVGGGYLTASDYLGEHITSLSADFVPGYQASTMINYSNFSFPVTLSVTGLYTKNYYRIMDLETNTLLDEFNDEVTGGAFGLSRAFSTFDRLDTQFSLQNLRRDHEGEIINQRVTGLLLSLVHDDTVWNDFEPSGGLRYNLSLNWADRIFGGQANYNLLQLDAQTYTSLDFIDPFLVFGARFYASASMGPDHPFLRFGGIGILPASGTIRGYRFGELIGSQIGTLNFELRFPLARRLNYVLWPLDFLLLKDLQVILFDDLGAVTNNFLELTGRNTRNSIGLGLRVHGFLLGKELLTIRFDISQRTDAKADPVYTWGLGQAF